MVKEDQIVISVSDISRVRFRCSKCHSEITLQLGQADCIPRACPVCNHSWEAAESPIHDLIKALKHVRDKRSELPLGLRFVLEHDVEKAQE